MWGRNQVVFIVQCALSVFIHFSRFVSCFVLPSVSLLHFPVIEQQVICWLPFTSTACWMARLCKTVNKVTSILLPLNKRKSQWFRWRYKLMLARLDHFFVSQHIYWDVSATFACVFVCLCNLSGSVAACETMWLQRVYMCNRLSMCHSGP